jgi:hypothetical protein
VSVRLVALLLLVASAQATAAGYVWEQLTPAAPYPASYNYPVYVAADGAFVALHPRGTWQSRDGKTWVPTPLPFSGMNSAYLSYVQHAGATWALGKLSGNYQGFTIDPIIQRTDDYRTWKAVGRSASLPKLVFYAAVSFRGAIWIVGGFDGTRAVSQVWRSTDGLAWVRMAVNAPWSPRANTKAIVFRDRLYIIGGGEIDGANAGDVWSSADGVQWRHETEVIAPEKPFGFTPIVFDDRVWLIGANRSGRFTSEMLVSADGKVWTAERAPWSPRGGVAAWTDGRALFITGGKYSTEKNGETTFVYSNDVWRMRRK